MESSLLDGDDGIDDVDDLVDDEEHVDDSSSKTFKLAGCFSLVLLFIGANTEFLSFLLR